MQNIVMFKIGHDESNVMHCRGGGIFYPWVNNSRKDSAHFNPINYLCSEFSSIEEILNVIYASKYDAEYVGTCHYRCLIGDIPTGLSYDESLNISADIINNVLDKYPGGIISTTYNKFNLKNYQQGPRWTGTKSIEYLLEVVKDDEEVDGILRNYLWDTENSFKTICCLPKDIFIIIFSIVCRYIQPLIELRSSKNDLTPRSVGYELETLTSALLINYWKKNKDTVARIKHTVL